MKIAFIGPGYPLRGGIAQFIAILAEKLQKEGHLVKIFSFKKQYPKLLFPGKEQVEKSKMVIPLDVDSTLIPYNPLTFNKTISKIKQYNPDVVILKYWIPFFAPAFGYILNKLSKSLNCKILFIIDNIDFHEKWFMGEKLTKYALKRADNFITMSDNVFETLVEMFPSFDKKAIFKLKHPTYDFYSTNCEVENKMKNNILFFGYIKEYKGLDLLLKAMPKVLESLPNLKLTVAGEVYGDETIYTSLIKENKLEEHVEFHNKYISNEEVQTFFLASDICVLPYKHATQSGIIQLSYAFNIPVIATNVGGIPEVVVEGKTGHLIPPNDINAISNSIISFYKKRDFSAYKQGIQEENKKYSWESFLDVINDICEDCS